MPLSAALPSTPAPDSLFAPGRRAAVSGALALVSLLAFEAIAVATAMPAVAQALGGLRQYGLAFGAHMALAVLGLVWAGRLCDQRGPFVAAAIGLALFGAGLLLAGAARDMNGLGAGRALQGLGSGLLSVTLYVGLGRLVPAALHPRLFASFAAAWVLPGLIGPALAATLTQSLGWRSVFLLVAALLPALALMLLPALRRLGAPPEPQALPRLWPWALAAAFGALLLQGLGQDARLALPALLLLGPAIVRLLPRGCLVAAPGLPAVIALRGLLAAAFFAAEAFIPLYLQREQGWSLGAAGLALSLAALSWSAASALQARLRRVETRRRALSLGFLLQGLGLLLALLPLAGAAAVWVLAGWTLVGFGVGLAWPLLSVQTLALSVPGAEGRNSAALQLADALASSLALALAGLLFAGGAGHGRVLLLCLGLSGLGLLLAPRGFATHGSGST